jgi:2-polyprenyl-3-methyl-5-hydroxy-6-metoxy-1,4-benzoquinol methylase
VLKISGGITEEGVIVGNTFDKYNSRNPIVRGIMNGFHASLNQLVEQVQPTSIHEIGCGEGYWVLEWNRRGLDARGSDFSRAVIDLAIENAVEQGLQNDLFDVRSVYELLPDRDSADLVVCCEVLEHLEDPDRALRKLQEVAKRFVILSVPREPLWSALNMARGKYWSGLGNTPGHIQRWSRKSFADLVSRHFVIEKTLSPLPWTMLLCRSGVAAG